MLFKGISLKMEILAGGEKMDWMNQVTELSKRDPEYQNLLRRLMGLEEDFILLRNSLPPEQREQLDRYISACEELDHRLMQLAYRLGAESK